MHNTAIKLIKLKSRPCGTDTHSFPSAIILGFIRSLKSQHVNLIPSNEFC